MTKNQKTRPLVSVLIPAYNSEQYIHACLESIIQQTYPNLEIIVVDDCSTDQTLKVAKEVLRASSRPSKCLKTQINHGGGGEPVFNWGLSYCKGKYVAKMDADDLMHPQRIEYQVEFLQKNQNIFLVGSDLELINEEGKTIGYRKHPITYDEIKRNFYLRSPVANPSIMFRNKPISFYKSKYKIANDYYTFFKLISENKKIANIPKYLLKYRIHQNSALRNNIKENWLINLEIKREIANHPKLKPSFLHRSLVAMQTFIILMIPSKIFYNLYLRKPI